MADSYMCTCTFHPSLCGTYSALASWPAMNICTHTLSATAQDGETALIQAARRGSTDVVVELVRGGANLDLQNKVC